MTIKKTGRSRYRIHTRLLSTPLMVLQIEWVETGRECWSNDGGMVECDSLPNRLFWLDATLEDITEANNDN